MSPSRGNPRIGFRATEERVALYEAAAEREGIEISEWLRRAADHALLPGQPGPANIDRDPPRKMGDMAGESSRPSTRPAAPPPPIRSITGVALPGGNEAVEARERKALGGKRFSGPDPKPETKPKGRR